MKIRILSLLLALPLLLAGCKNDNPVDPPVQNDIPAGTIPVVFHVLYENASIPMQNPPAAVFKQRIEAMNKFYASTLFTNTDIPGVPSQNIGLTFTLATHDPNGAVLAEPGVHRVRYAGATNMDAENFLHSSRETPKNQPIFWDPNRYVNIWLFGFSKPGVSGAAIVAYATTSHPLFGLSGGGEAYFGDLPPNMHGVTLNHRYFLPPANVDLSNQWKVIDEDEGLFTLCHEMGHYLGLKHAFSEENGCQNPDNASDDGCADTPKYDYWGRYKIDIEPFEKNPTPEERDNLPYDIFQRRSCSGEMFLSTNVMDYYFSVRTQFTPDQKGRMEYVMEYSPLIPRGKVQTKALLDNFTGEITGELPEPQVVYCRARPQR